jgi:PAS domain S-box-containing protein
MNNPLPELPAAFPDAVVVVNSRGRIIQANAAAAALFGFEEQRINGMSLRALFPGNP